MANQAKNHECQTCNRRYGRPETLAKHTGNTWCSKSIVERTTPSGAVIPVPVHRSEYPPVLKASDSELWQMGSDKARRQWEQRVANVHLVNVFEDEPEYIDTNPDGLKLSKAELVAAGFGSHIVEHYNGLDAPAEPQPEPQPEPVVDSLDAAMATRTAPAATVKLPEVTQEIVEPLDTLDAIAITGNGDHLRANKSGPTATQLDREVAREFQRQLDAVAETALRAVRLNAELLERVQTLESQRAHLASPDVLDATIPMEW